MNGGSLVVIGAATTTTGTISTAYYGSAFNFSISTACSNTTSARIAVVVNPNPTYALTVTPTSATACQNAIQSLNVQNIGNAAGYTSYVWSPTTNLYTDAGATTAYTGTNLATVYYKSATSTTATYTATASGSGCTNTKTVVATTPNPPAVTATATPAAVCNNGTAALLANASLGYCTPSGANTGATYGITNVTSTGAITNINNNSTPSVGGYTDYTSGAGISQNVNGTFTITTTGYSTAYWKLYVDWNQNGSFLDAGELLYVNDAYYAAIPGNSVPNTFTVPATAINGTTRMRVGNAYISPLTDACYTSIYTEWEDYKFTVIGGVAPPASSYTFAWTESPAGTTLASTTGASVFGK